MDTAGTAGVIPRRMRRVARTWSIVVIGITLVTAITHLVAPETDATDYWLWRGERPACFESYPLRPAAPTGLP